MMIYLYKKTHKQTGLKYLGKTTSSNPHAYKGSGIHWTNHIKKYGYNVNTEILKECDTQEELEFWGVYYSQLWNVVDDPSWANLKQETGDGGSIGIGEKHPNYDHVRKTWIHKTEKVENLTIWEMVEKYKVHKSGLSEISRQVRRGHCGGWYFVPEGSLPEDVLKEHYDRKRTNPNLFKKKI